MYLKFVLNLHWYIQYLPGFLPQTVFVLFTFCSFPAIKCTEQLLLCCIVSFSLHCYKAPRLMERSQIRFLYKRGCDIILSGSNHKRKWICLKRIPLQIWDLQHHCGNKTKSPGFLNLMRFKCPRAPAFRGRSNVRARREKDSVSLSKGKKISWKRFTPWSESGESYGKEWKAGSCECSKGIRFFHRSWLLSSITAILFMTVIGLYGNISRRRVIHQFQHCFFQRRSCNAAHHKPHY